MTFADGSQKSVHVGMDVAITNGQSGSHFEIWETKVLAVGTKYVTVLGWYRFNYNGIEHTTHGAKGEMYPNIEAYETKKIEKSFIFSVKQDINVYGITYEQALKIKQILEGK